MSSKLLGGFIHWIFLKAARYFFYCWLLHGYVFLQSCLFGLGLSLCSVGSAAFSDVLARFSSLFAKPYCPSQDTGGSVLCHTRSLVRVFPSSPSSALTSSEGILPSPGASHLFPRVHTPLLVAIAH